MGNIVEELDGDLIAVGPTRDELMTALADIRGSVLEVLGEDHPLYDRWLGDTMGSPLSVPGLVAEYVARGLDWAELRRMLRLVVEHIDAAPVEDHRPDEATDEATGNAYCLGCDVGQEAQLLDLAIRDYLDGRGLA